MGRTLGGWDSTGNRPGFSPEKPWLFNHLDLVSFYEVTEQEYDKMERDFGAGQYAFDISETAIDMDQYIAKFDTAEKDPEYQAWRERQSEAADKLAALEQKLFDEWTISKQSGGGADEDGDIDSDEIAVIESPVNANVWKVLVKPGDVLEEGQTVAVLEAMKMEINLVVGEDQVGAEVVKVVQPPGSVVSPGTVVVKARRSQE
jgi:biotin carboxyl carrier protein